MAASEPMASSSLAVRARLSALRSTPAPSVMVAATAGARAASSSVAGPSTGGGLPQRRQPAHQVGADPGREHQPLEQLFEASRFAPCTPVQATSPQAYSPGTVLRPSRSVRTPPLA